jgi:hypothetical protein
MMMTSALRLLLLLLQLTHSRQDKEESLVTKPFLTSSRFVEPSFKEMNRNELLSIVLFCQF